MTALRLSALTLALLLFALPVHADITGSNIVKVSPSGPMALGQYVNLRLRVSNASSDLNWIGRVNFRFPLCCTIVAMSYDDSPPGSNGNWVFETEGIPGWEVSYVDGAGDEWGEIPGGDYGYLDLLVHVDESCGEGNTVQVYYDLLADGFGAEPHELLNLFFTVTFDYVAVEDGSVSTIKSLY